MMETKEFIDKTKGIVNFLVNAAGQDNYMSAARIITKQANMDCDGLIEECNEAIVMLEKAKIELLVLRQQCPQRERLDNPNYDIEEKRKYWGEAFDIFDELDGKGLIKCPDKAK